MTMETVTLELTSKEIAVIHQALHEKAVRDIELGINKLPEDRYSIVKGMYQFVSDLSLKFLKLRKEYPSSLVRDFEFPQLPIK